MIGIVVVSHLDLSSRLIEISERIMGRQTNLAGVNIEMNEPMQSITAKISEGICACMSPELQEVLVLTDLYGSTPMNTSLRECRSLPHSIEVLTGVNLPMLISALVNRNKLSLSDLAAKALADGRKSIQNAKSAAFTS